MSFGRTNYRDGGTRGGAGEFKWDSVRGDDSFLGASVMAPRVGRRDLGRDYFWYTKSRDTLGRPLGASQADARKRLEILERKRADDAALADALGETLVSSRAQELEIESLKKFLERGGVERESGDTERRAGLGAAPAKRHEHVVRDSRVALEAERRAKEKRERELVAADAARRRALEPPSEIFVPLPEDGFVAADERDVAAETTIAEESKKKRKSAHRESSKKKKKKKHKHRRQRDGED